MDLESPRPAYSVPPLPLWERSDRIDRCDPGEGLRPNDRPEPLTPTSRASFARLGLPQGERERTVIAEKSNQCSRGQADQTLGVPSLSGPPAFVLILIQR